MKDHCFSPGKLEFLALKCSVSNKCVTLSDTFVHDWQQEQPTSYVLNSSWLNYCASQDHRNNWLDIKYHPGRSEGAADAHLHAEAFVRMHMAGAKKLKLNSCSQWLLQRWDLLSAQKADTQVCQRSPLEVSRLCWLFYLGFGGEERKKNLRPAELKLQTATNPLQRNESSSRLLCLHVPCLLL